MKFRISSQYGVLEEVRSGRHTGVDIAMPEGTKLYSTMDGTVQSVFDNVWPIGNGVKIKAENGQELIYGHMDKVNVKTGEHVDAGELIGLSGNTGNSTGPHLHFGMKDNGNFIDPTDKLDGILGPLGHMLYNPIKEQVSHHTKETIYGIFSGIFEVLLESIGAITLVGSGILLLARVVGYENGSKYTGCLLLANVLIKYLIGGLGS